MQVVAGAALVSSGSAAAAGNEQGVGRGRERLGKGGWREMLY